MCDDIAAMLYMWWYRCDQWYMCDARDRIL